MDIFNTPPGHQACSFAFSAVDFLNQTNQTEKVFDSKKRASRRYSDEWILWTDVRPVKRYGRFATLLVKKENTTLICNSLYVIDFKLDISIGMERMDDPEGFVVKVLMGRS